MKIHQDSFFKTGHMHDAEGKPCQDYAYSGVSKTGIYYAIVSDGCSASPNSDLGCRILTHWFRQYLDEVQYADINFHDRSNWINDLQRFELVEADWIPNQMALDATLVIAVCHPKHNSGAVLIIGDGHVVFRHAKEGIKLYTMFWNNLPPYISYNLIESRKKQLWVETGEEKRGLLISTVIVPNSDQPEILPGTEEILAKMNHIDAVEAPGMLIEFELSSFNSVSVFSDGLSSFDNEVTAGDLGSVFTNFKSKEGEFVKRTCLANMKRVARSDNTKPLDDFSMATLIFDHGDEKNPTENGDPIGTQYYSY